MHASGSRPNGVSSGTSLTRRSASVVARAFLEAVICVDADLSTPSFVIVASVATEISVFPPGRAHGR